MSRTSKINFLLYELNRDDVTGGESVVLSSAFAIHLNQTSVAEVGEVAPAVFGKLVAEKHVDAGLARLLRDSYLRPPGGAEEVSEGEPGQLCRKQ